MTCKDCVSYDVCKKHYNEENSALPDLFDLWLNPGICSDFKNKADVVPVEWISVKDRLPENEERVLVAVDSDKSDTKLDTDRMIYRQWVRWGMSVTHWMPLPEPPKKEGATDGK